MEKVKIKISELADLMKDNDVYIETPNGISNISEVYRKNGPGKEITFSDNTVIKCADDHLMCDDNNLFDWKPAKEYDIGSSINNKIITNISSLSHQEWYDFTVENETSSYYHNGIVHHNSGKSCMIYMLYRYCVDNNMKLLITVPSTSLCEQLYSDFEDYVSDDHKVSDYAAKLYGGQDKTVDKLVYISTWQTCANMDKEWLSQFEFYIADEAHQAQAKELSSIIDSLENCRYRIGLTGTLNGTNIHEIEMHARFGDIFKMVTTRELIERGIVTDININMVRLTHEKSDIEFFHSICKNDYQREIDYIIGSENRNNYIVNLGLTLPTNTLLLFNRIDAHGMKLYEMMRVEAIKHKKKIFYITGSVKTKDREIIRKSLDGDLPLFYDITLENGTIITVDGEFYDLNKVKDLIGNTFKSDMFSDEHIYINGETNSVVVNVKETEGSFNLLATYGTLAIGVNIKRLHNLIFCHPFKARILNLQSIGRLLRKSEVKSKVYLYDLIDDYRKGKKTNHAYKHAVNRMEIYEEEGFEYDIIEQRI